MRKRHSLAAYFFALLALGGCDPGDRAQGRIHLPEGDPERGKAHFVALGCVNCHVVVGAELPEPEGPLRVILGSTGRIASYGDLVTSIVNPSHKLSPRYREDEVSEDGESLMAVYNDVMTVSQLTDLVAFLQQHYQRISRPRYQYRRYDEEILPAAERARSGRDDEED